MADDVQLTDLVVIQKFSLAVRGATASRADVVAALQADLAYLGASAQASAAKAPAKAAARKAPGKPAAANPRA